VRLTRVLVVHPQRIVAEAVARRLDAEDGIRVAEIAPDEPSAMNALRALGPDIAVVHTEPELRSSLRFIATLSEQQPPVRVVALLPSDNPEFAVRAIRAGAVAVVTKDSSANELAAAVTAVGDDRGWLASPVVGAVLDALRESSPAPNEYDERLARLTAREREILDGLIAGSDRATIARDLMVSIGTVRTHTRNILAKLEVHSSLEAVSVALRCNALNGSVNGRSTAPVAASGSKSPVTRWASKALIVVTAVAAGGAVSGMIGIPGISA
jgi:DNA-binding NarL/FixJ family response regulator